MPYKHLPEITERQEQIVNLVYKFRFINRHQIQKILNHKDPKRINVWLKDLVEKGYLGRIYSHKLLENTKPAIYYLNNNGILYIQNIKGYEYGQPQEWLEQKYIKKFYQDKHASETFVNHCISICQFYIQLKEHEKTKKNLDYSILTKTEMWIMKQIEEDEDEFAKIKEYLSDLYVERFINPESKNIDSSVFFFTLFDSHVPRYAIRYKVDQHIKLHDDGDWKYYKGLDGQFPVIFFILSDQKKVNNIGKYIKRQFDETMLDVEGMVFMLTTHEDALKEGVTGNIWEEVKEGNKNDI